MITDETSNFCFHDIFPNIKLKNTIVFQPKSSALPSLCEAQPYVNFQQIWQRRVLAGFKTWILT